MPAPMPDATYSQAAHRQRRSDPRERNQQDERVEHDVHNLPPREELNSAPADHRSDDGYNYDEITT